MRTIAAFAGLAALCFASLPVFAKTPPADAKATPAQIVIVFKDGHRQTFNLSDIARIDFSGSHESAAGTTSDSVPARGQFVGRWVVGINSDSNETFVITLKDDGNATRSFHALHGTWQYVNGEAQITWDDGAKDAIRKAGSKFQKYAYSSDKSFSDTPDNVAPAQNTTPKPI